MNIHLAGIEADFNRSYIYTSTGHRNYLTTFEHFSRTKSLEMARKQSIFCYTSYENCNVILDSGAFSRANGVVNFTLDDYIKFLHHNHQFFYKYINLDYPLMNKETSQEEIEYSLFHSENNLKIMESESLTPIPVYQRKWNRLDILEKYLEKYDYICIAGCGNFTGIKKEIIIYYLDKVFELNSKYKKKLHGLGQTKVEILLQYPFYSVDSTSWKMNSAMGGISRLNELDLHFESTYLNLKTFQKFLFIKELYDHRNKSGHMVRNKYNAKSFNRIEKILTELWKERGVEWN